MGAFPVKQEDRMGCGVACVAFILKIKYHEALKLFKNPRKAKSKGFYCKEILEALQKGNMYFEYKYIKTSKIKRKIYENNSIVFLRRSNKYSRGHYLCRWGDKWMDPWINFPKLPINPGFRKKLPEKPIYLIMTCLNHFS